MPTKKRPASASRLQKTRTKSARTLALDTRQTLKRPAAATLAGTSKMQKSSRVTPSWPQLVPMLDTDGEASEDETDPCVDTNKAGIHYHGTDFWSCGAGGGDDEVKFKADLDFGSFPMPEPSNEIRKNAKGKPKRKRLGLGNTGVLLQHRGVGVQSMPADAILGLVKDRTTQRSYDLDPSCRYPDAIPLENMIDNLEKLCKEFELQGSKIVTALKSFMGKEVNDYNIKFKARVQKSYSEERHGHIWGAEDPAQEYAYLEMDLEMAQTVREKKSLQRRLDELQKQWQSYNNSSYHRRDIMTIYLAHANASKAAARVNISIQVFRRCCCVNPFTGIVEL
eukprot:gnl/MRDRNA2_/MRDRNA2_161124_c0_seq1.p1 gnl/MRDRNA2_/MRDRNA2_161124_c0~~gnl/MRDRNA2_/MRDRNA2_161124_c0_seq1.p1  ORF type:complete len:337 (-),score=58.41 gnl/MRDRNA2_/MRDRNA2_161124_c0_seq1:188-1198(-)